MSAIIGEGNQYAEIRIAADNLVDEWVPWGVENSQNPWSHGFITTRRTGNDYEVYTDTYDWVKSPLGHMKRTSLQELRAMGISLLIYVAAEERRNK